MSNGSHQSSSLASAAAILLFAAIATVGVSACSPSSDSAPTDPAPIVMEGENLLVITGEGSVLWNRQAIEMDQLPGLLAATKELPIEPLLRFEPEASASFEQSATALRHIKESGVTKFGFVGNEKYREFGK